ncbi:MAG: tetraacyldisaccharide 4'-kinase [Paludibacteraceae bacterium]|nr:tetraacyldisaccharide 4'-kinase [Paludibacteraceae bacterium]
MNNTLKYILLKPLSVLYGIGVGLRNKLFDLGIFHSHKCDLTTISVGNITVGGTGKTPHAEYLLEYLSKRVSTAYLSRGYKRSTAGFKIADEKSTASTIGDEAYQIYRKFENVTVAVDGNRVNALKKLQQHKTEPKVVVLDDAYQHRKLHPDLNILLIDYNRLTYRDLMLPLGELRESSENTDRADIIIFTKCPDTMQPVDMLSTRTQINPFPYQTLYYTSLSYGEPKGLFTDKKIELYGKEVLLVTGIAQPQHLHKHLEQYASLITALKYPDHHRFTSYDIQEIAEDYEGLANGNRVIITTEKDAARLISMEIPESIKNDIYTIGIEIEFLFNGKQNFNAQIDKFLRNQNLYLAANN